MGDELRRRSARGELGEENEHLAIPEAVVDEVEGAIHLVARSRRKRLDLPHFRLVRALYHMERHVAFRRLLEGTLRREALKQVDDQAFFPNERFRRRAGIDFTGELPLPFRDTGPERVINGRACQKLGLRPAQQVAQLEHDFLLTKRCRAVPGKGIEQEPQQSHPLIELRFRRAVLDGAACLPRQNRAHLVVRAVLLEERVVDSELIGNVVIAQELGEQLAVHGLAHLLVQRDDFRQILPAARRDERFPAAGARLDLVEAVLLRLEERRHRRVYAHFRGVRLPRAVIGFDVDFA